MKSNLKHRKGAIASLSLCMALSVTMGVSSLQGAVVSAEGSNVVPTSTSVAVTSVMQAHTKAGVKIASDARMDLRTHLLKSSRYYNVNWMDESAWNSIDANVQGNGIMATLTGTNSTKTEYTNRVQKTTKLDLSNNTQNDTLLKMDLSTWFNGNSDATANFMAQWDHYTYQIKLTDGTNSIVLFYVPANANTFSTPSHGYRPGNTGISTATNMPTDWPAQTDVAKAGLYVIANGQTTLGGLQLDGTFSGIGGTQGTLGDGTGSPIPAFHGYDATKSTKQYCCSYDEFKQVLYYDHGEKAIYADMWDGEKTVKKLVRDLDATGESNGNDNTWGGFNNNASQVHIEVTQQAYGIGNARSFAVYTVDGVDLDFDSSFVGKLVGGVNEGVTTVALTQPADDESEPLVFDGYKLNEDGSFAGNSLYKNTDKAWYTTRGEQVTAPNTFTNKKTEEGVELDVVGGWIENAEGEKVATFGDDGKVTVPDDGEYIVVFGRKEGETSGPMDFVRRAIKVENYVSSIDATKIFQTYTSAGADVDRAATNLNVGKNSHDANYWTTSWWYDTTEPSTNYNAYHKDNGTLKDKYNGKALYLPLSRVNSTNHTNQMIRSTSLNLSDNTKSDVLLDIDLAAALMGRPMKGNVVDGSYRIRLTDGVKFVDLYYRSAMSMDVSSTNYYLPKDTNPNITANWGAQFADGSYAQLFVLTDEATSVPTEIKVPSFTELKTGENGHPVYTNDVLTGRRDASYSCVSEVRQNIYYDAAENKLYVRAWDDSNQVVQKAVDLGDWKFHDESNVTIEITYKGGENAKPNHYSCIAHAVDGMEIAFDDSMNLKGSYAIRKDGTFAGKSSHATTGADIQMTEGEAFDLLDNATMDGYVVEKAEIEGIGAATNDMVIDTVGQYTLTLWGSKVGADDIVYVQTRTVNVVKNETPYTVSYDKGTATDAVDMPSEETITYGNTVDEPTAPTSPTKTFKGWTLNGAAYNFATPVKSNILLVATWEDKLTVSFDAGEGVGNPATVYVEKNGTVTLPVVEKEGYTFEGWYTAEDTKWEDTTKVEASIELTAQWTVTTYLVQFNSDGGSTVDSQFVKYNELVAKPTDPTKDDYTFAGWTLNGEAYDFDTPVTEDMKLVASWTLNGAANNKINSISMDVADGFIFIVNISVGESVSYKINDEGKGTLVPTVVTAGKEWKVSIELAAKQITDEITIQVGNNAEYKTSVLSYLESLIKGNYDDTTKKIASGLIVYADYAQKQFAYEGKGYAMTKTTVDLTATKAAIAAQDAPTDTVKVTGNATAYKGMTLQLNSKLNALVVFQGLADGYEITVNGKAAKLDTSYADGTVVVTIENINAGALNEVYTVNVLDNDANPTIEFSALAYITGYWSEDNGNLSGLCKALYYVYTANNAQ